MSKPIVPQDDAAAKLARRIDATQRTERLRDLDYVAELRRRGACDLHRICADLVGAVNGRLRAASLELSPPAYSAADFRSPGPNLIQIGSQGRQMQIAFEAPAQLASTDKFLTPYVLEGEVRTYNQSMLERFDIRSRMIFFCVEDDGALWRFFDWRTRATGALTGDALAELLQPLF